MVSTKLKVYLTSYFSILGLPFNRSLLGFKASGLTEADLNQLVTLKSNSLKLAMAAKGAGRLGTMLNAVSNANDIAETCRQYGAGSTLCHETAVGDTSNFAASEYIGAIAGVAAKEWLGCNAVFDIEIGSCNKLDLISLLNL